MKKLNVEEFNPSNAHSKLVKFVNEKNINQNDILKIIWAPNNTLHLFYYTQE